MFHDRTSAIRAIAQLGLTLLLSMFSGTLPAAGPMEESISIAVAAQPLGESLRAFAKQANLQILFDSALVSGKSAHALSGTMSAGAALAELLQGTGLEAREQTPGVIVIRPLEQRWLMMVATKSTDPARDVDFNRWYDDIDIPDVLQVPGYKRARRGRRIEVPQLPRVDQQDDNTYVALYDILSPNIDRTIIDMLMATRKMEAAGRSTDLLKVTERLYYRQLAPAVDAPAARSAQSKSFLLLERVECCRDEAGDAQLNDWYATRHVPDMLKIPGFVRATRYQLYRVLMIEPRSAPRFLTVYEVNARSAEEVVSVTQAAARKQTQSGRSTELFVEHGTALYLKINDVSAR